MTTSSDNRRIAKDIGYLLAILGLLLAALIFLFIYEARSFRGTRFLRSRGASSSAFLSRRGPLAPSDANFVQTWMTFDYVNRIFNLPPAYLKERLSIADPRYPALTISGYARSTNTDAVAFLVKVQDTVRQYAPVQ